MACLYLFALKSVLPFKLQKLFPFWYLSLSQCTEINYIHFQFLFFYDTQAKIF